MNGVNFLKSERFYRLSKEGVWIILGQVAVIGGALFGVKIITGLLSPQIYGELALGLTVATLVNQLLFGPLTNGITRFYATATEHGALYKYLYAVKKLLLLTTLLVLLILVLILAGLFVASQIAWSTLVISAIILSILSGYNSAFSSIQNAARQRAIVSLHQGIDSWARFLIAAGLVVVFGATSAIAMIGYSLSLVIVLISQYLFFRRIAPDKIYKGNDSENWQKQICAYSWPFASWGVFTWAQAASDKWALQFFASPSDVGMYVVLFQLGYYPASMVTGMAMQLLAPIYYQWAGDASDNKRNANVNRVSWILTGIILLLTGFGFLLALSFHGWVFRTFVASKYAEVSYLLPWMLLSGGLFAASQSIALNLMSQMRTSDMTTCKIITAIVGVLFNFVGAYLYGIPGIVFSGILFACLNLIWMIVLSTKTAPIQFSNC